MPPRNRRSIVFGGSFAEQVRAIRAKHPRVREFLDGVYFILERDPSVGGKWGSLWFLSSVDEAAELPVVTLFYTFDDKKVILHSIIGLVIL